MYTIFEQHHRRTWVSFKDLSNFNIWKIQHYWRKEKNHVKKSRQLLNDEHDDARYDVQQSGTKIIPEYPNVIL